MRAVNICAMALVVGLLVGQQAESYDIAAPANDFQETIREDEVVAPFEDIDESLYQEDVEAPVLATAFMGCGFQGESRNVGTPMVVSGHSNIGSLKVPAGQCASLFDRNGYNDNTEGHMLSIRGPMDVPCLSDIKLHENGPTWKDITASYKMGPCDAKPTEEMATAAVKAAAETVPDLQSLSNAAKKAAEGHFGSIVQSFTKSDKDDGIARPYSPRVVSKIAQLMGVGAGAPPGPSPVVKTNDVKPYPFNKHKVVEDLDKIETHKKKATGSGAGSAGVRPAAGSALFKWEHDHLGAAAWKKFSIPFPKLPSPVPFKHDNGPVDDAEDLIHDAKKDAMGCDPLLGCRPPPPPCMDNDPKQICADYVANGDCQFDFVERDCRKSCNLCPPDEGSIASDAYTGPAGHYYLGSARRRIGAGFGRRRRSPVPHPKGSGKRPITAPKPEHKEVVKVPVSILHPNGRKTIEVPGKHGVDCKKCVLAFDAAGGCDVWKKGGDPDNLVPKGCMICAKEAAVHCKIPFKEAEHNELPKPVEHPNAAAKIITKDAKHAGHKVLKHLVPEAIAKAVHKVLKEAGVSVPDVHKALGSAFAKLAPPAAGSGAHAIMHQMKVVTEAAAAVTQAAAAATGSAAAVATGSAADAEAVMVKATATLVKAIVHGTGITAAKAKVVAAKAMAAAAEAAAGAAQTQADHAMVASAHAQMAASQAKHPGKLMPPIKDLPPTPAEHMAKEAESWAETQLKKAEAAEKAQA
jgi:hypothetical protein